MVMICFHRRVHQHEHSADAIYNIAKKRAVKALIGFCRKELIGSKVLVGRIVCSSIIGPGEFLGGLIIRNNALFRGSIPV